MKTNTTILLTLISLTAIPFVMACSELEAETEPVVQKNVQKKVQMITPIPVSLGMTITEGVTLGAEEKGIITAEITAQLTKWHVKENDFVKAGQKIASLDPIDYQISLEQARAGLAAIEAQYVSIEKDFDRMQALHEGGSISQSKFDMIKAQRNVVKKQIESAEKSVNLMRRKVGKATVKAPFDGVITAKVVPLGKFIMATMPGGGDIATIEKTDRLKASFSVSEMFYSELSEGIDVSFFIPSLKKTIETKIDSKGKSISAMKTFSLISYVDNKDATLPAGVFAVATVQTPERSRIIVTPTAVITTGNQLGKIYYVKDGVVTALSISIGFTFEQGLEIIGDIPKRIIKDISNVNEGEKVVPIEG